MNFKSESETEFSRKSVFINLNLSANKPPLVDIYKFQPFKKFHSCQTMFFMPRKGQSVEVLIFFEANNIKIQNSIVIRHLHQSFQQPEQFIQRLQ